MALESGLPPGVRRWLEITVAICDGLGPAGGGVIFAWAYSQSESCICIRQLGSEVVRGLFWAGLGWGTRRLWGLGTGLSRFTRSYHAHEVEGNRTKCEVEYMA